MHASGRTPDSAKVGAQPSSGNSGASASRCSVTKEKTAAHAGTGMAAAGRTVSRCPDPSAGEATPDRGTGSHRSGAAGTGRCGAGRAGAKGSGRELDQSGQGQADEQENH